MSKVFEGMTAAWTFLGNITKAGWQLAKGIMALAACAFLVGILINIIKG